MHDDPFLFIYEFSQRKNVTESTITVGINGNSRDARAFLLLKLLTNIKIINQQL
jgi:hypothetical protein